MIRHHDDLVRSLQQVRDGRLSRRAFVGAAAAAGFSVAMAERLLATTTVAAAPARQDEPPQGGQVIVGLSQEPTIFNPLKSTLEVDRGVQFAIFDSLWRIDPDAVLHPNLATEIPSVENGGISDDGLTYTFRLRDDAAWHDGEPFTAADVVFSHQTIMNPDFVPGTRIGHDQVAEISAPDDHTVTMTLAAPYAPFLLTWADTYIVPEHVLAEVEDLNTAEFNSTAPVGTGPFTFQDRVAGDLISLQANPNYHGPGPYLDTVIFKYVPDLNVLYTQFQTGEVDATGIQGITAENFAEAQTLEGKVIHSEPTGFVEFIYMNHGNPVFQDLAVRQALYAAMDKQNIIDTIYYGVHGPIETYLPTQSWAYNPDLEPHVFDIAAANAILDEAGWAPGDDGIRQKDDVRLSFTNSTTAGNAVREQAQQYLQQTWAEIGVDMQIENMPAAVIWGDYFNQSQYDSVMVGWTNPPDPDGTSRFHSAYIPAQGGGGQNTMQYKNEELDTLWEAGVAELDQEARAEIYRQAQQIMRDDLAYLPIFQYVFIEGTAEGLENYRQNAFVVSNQWNIYEWYWSV
ncbi:MAG: ABC-type dipeptide transport system, periplasmic component [Thermomicrobiales bacterium]|nr:ABC-type dipeptide transport system, periplasmic component [Thermomicrobiales bacterium]